MKKNYSKPFMAVEIFEPQQFIAACEGVITYTYKTIAGNYQSCEDVNKNGIFDSEEQHNNGIHHNINPQGNDLILTGDDQFAEFMRIRTPVFYWKKNEGMNTAQLGWAIQESQHGVLEPYSGGGNHLYVIDYEETYTKSLS